MAQLPNDISRFLEPKPWKPGNRLLPWRLDIDGLQGGSLQQFKFINCFFYPSNMKSKEMSSGAFAFISMRKRSAPFGFLDPSIYSI